MLDNAGTALSFAGLAVKALLNKDFFLRNIPGASLVESINRILGISKMNNSISHTNLVRTNTRGAIAYLNDVNKILSFQFNPEEISDVKDVEYADRGKTGFNNVDYIWVKGGTRRISFKLQLDASQGSNTSTFFKFGRAQIDNGIPGTLLFAPFQPVLSSTVDTDYSRKIKIGSVYTHNPSKGTLEQVEFLQSLLIPDTEKNSAKGHLKVKFLKNGAYISPKDQFFPPPEIIFSYGPILLKGVLATLNVTHQTFDKNLVPLRTECEVSIRVNEGKLTKKIPDIGTLASIDSAQSALSSQYGAYSTNRFVLSNRIINKGFKLT